MRFRKSGVWESTGPGLGDAGLVDHLRFSLPQGSRGTAIIHSVTPSVLVVDDDATFRSLARRLLAADGLTVIGEADSASAALSAARRLKPAAVLVDVELPDGNGITLARELVALPWRPRVVLISSNGDAVSAQGIRRSGAIAFVSKADLPNAPLARLLGAE